jgi:hypothetical protein
LEFLFKLLEKLVIQLYLFHITEIETYNSSDKPEAFLYRSQALESPGKLKGEKIYNFLFMNFEAKSETYYGMGGKIRY